MNDLHDDSSSSNFGARGTDSKFEAEAKQKVLVPKLKRSSILIYQIHVHMNTES